MRFAPALCVFSRTKETNSSISTFQSHQMNVVPFKSEYDGVWTARYKEMVSQHFLGAKSVFSSAQESQTQEDIKLLLDTLHQQFQVLIDERIEDSFQHETLRNMISVLRKIPSNFVEKSFLSDVVALIAYLMPSKPEFQHELMDMLLIFTYKDPSCFIEFRNLGILDMLCDMLFDDGSIILKYEIIKIYIRFLLSDEYHFILLDDRKYLLPIHLLFIYIIKQLKHHIKNGCPDLFNDMYSKLLNAIVLIYITVIKLEDNYGFHIENKIILGIIFLTKPKCEPYRKNAYHCLLLISMKRYDIFSRFVNNLFQLISNGIKEEDHEIKRYSMFIYQNITYYCESFPISNDDIFGLIRNNTDEDLIFALRVMTNISSSCNHIQLIDENILHEISNIFNYACFDCKIEIFNILCNLVSKNTSSLLFIYDHTDIILIIETMLECNDTRIVKKVVYIMILIMQLSDSYPNVLYDFIHQTEDRRVFETVGFMMNDQLLGDEAMDLMCIYESLTK